VVFLSDFDQLNEDRLSKMQRLSNAVLKNDWEILIILFFTVGATQGKVWAEARLTS